MRKITNLFFILVLFANSTVAQEKIKSTFQGRHHMLSPAELNNKNFNLKAFTETSPPVGTVRSIAEFEPNEGVIIRASNWGFGIPMELIVEMSQDVIVTTIVSSQSLENDLIDTYTQNGVNLTNCNFILAPSDSYWTRDYSPWFISVDNQVAIVNFPYDRPQRPDDDDIPIEFASFLNLDLYGMPVMQTGGNYMSDGWGIAASTDLVVDENTDLTTTEIRQHMEDFLGVSNYYITTDPLDDYIKHIDCWGKFLDVDKILIGQVDASDPRYNDYEAMADYWANETSSYGNNYQVYRTYAPNGQPYTNSLIMNNKVFVPIMTGSASAWNASALAVYEAAMPGYEILGFEENQYTPWEETDALHCRVHEIADRNMLSIRHLPILGEVPYDLQYVIDAEIIPYTGQPVTSATLYYNVDGGPFTPVSMTFVSGNTYTALIPEHDSGSVIQYYINATDQSGNDENHPYIGQPDPHEFIIGVSTNTSYIDNPSFILNVFPNPASEHLFVNILSESNRIVDIIIYDINGNRISGRQVNVHSGNIIHEMNISNLASGIYMLRLQSGKDEIRTKRFVVK